MRAWYGVSAFESSCDDDDDDDENFSSSTKSTKSTKKTGEKRKEEQYREISGGNIKILNIHELDT